MSVRRNSYWRSRKGVHYEDEALAFLQNKGLLLMTRNYRCNMGELDLVLLDGEILVFAEVRFRASASFGGPLGSITWSKQKRIRNAALHFLICHKQYKDLACRFDVLGVQTDTKGQTAIQWIRAAFC